MYNEIARIGPTLAKLAKSKLHDVEIVLVDDGSTDGTASFAEATAAEVGLERVRVLRQATNRGKGAAVRRGMLEARGDHRVFVDADLSVEIEDILACFELLEDDAASFVYASRAHADSAFARGQPPHRVFVGRSFNWLVRRLGLASDRDTQCGLKGFHASVVPDIFGVLVTERFAFDVEVFARAERLGVSIRAVPVSWTHVEYSRVRTLRDGVDMLISAVRLRRTLRR